MTFLRPELLFLIPVYLFIVFLFREKRPDGLRYSLSGLLAGELRENPLKKNFFKIIRVIAAILIIIAASGPGSGSRSQRVVRDALDLMIVMDVSTSMLAIDFEPSDRMTAAKLTAERFVAMRENDRIGLVIFEALPLLYSPMTFDHDSLIERIRSLEAGMVGKGGTAIGLGMALALRYLERTSSEGDKVMVLLTDGANNAGEIEPIEAARAARSLGVRIYTIGCGRPGPARIPHDHPLRGRIYLTIPDEIEEDSLTEIAEMTGGRYFRADSYSRLDEIYTEINRLERSEAEYYEHYSFEPEHRLYLLAGLFYIILEILSRLISRGIRS